jgi:hypothetical protein
LIRGLPPYLTPPDTVKAVIDCLKIEIDESKLEILDLRNV